MIRRDTLRVSLLGIKKIPDPSEIYTTFQWLFLDSISESILRYDYQTGAFEPNIAESWDVSGSKLTFQLRDDLKFNDGTPLTSSDVLASLERIVRLKKATHFELWKYLKNCDSNSECNGLRVDGNTLEMDFVGDTESLLHFLASPESSVWSKEDTLSEAFKPKRFSGLYTPILGAADKIVLKLNGLNARLARFPRAPSEVEVYGGLGRWESVEAIKKGEIDTFIGDYIPFSNLIEEHPSVKFQKTIPLVLIYALAMNDYAPKVSLKFIENVWKIQDDSKLMTPAYSMLPLGMEGSLGKDEFVSAFKASEPKTFDSVKLGVPEKYFSPNFLDKIISAAKDSGFELKIVIVPISEFIEVLGDPSKAKFDYVMVGYVASDKFPFAQLKLLAGPREIEFPTPTPDMTPKQSLELLKSTQISFLKSQTILPFFFVPSITLFRSDLDLGNQPLTDAELQFWRINENLEDFFSVTN